MKVQRPGVKESIALDIYILRSLAVVIRRVRKINSDLGEILDEVCGLNHRRRVSVLHYMAVDTEHPSGTSFHM